MFKLLFCFRGHAITPVYCFISSCSSPMCSVASNLQHCSDKSNRTAPQSVISVLKSCHLSLQKRKEKKKSDLCVLGFCALGQDATSNLQKLQLLPSALAEWLTRWTLDAFTKPHLTWLPECYSSKGCKIHQVFFSSLLPNPVWLPRLWSSTHELPASH